MDTEDSSTDTPAGRVHAYLEARARLPWQPDLIAHATVNDDCQSLLASDLYALLDVRHAGQDATDIKARADELSAARQARPTVSPDAPHIVPVPAWW